VGIVAFSQCGPSNPSVQSQLRVPLSGTHVPPFWHGLGSHGFGVVVGGLVVVFGGITVVVTFGVVVGGLVVVVMFGGGDVTGVVTFGVVVGGLVVEGALHVYCSHT